MPLISDEYKELNRKLHEDNKNYGTKGMKYLDNVMEIIKEYDTKDLLDYGCGKSTLGNNLPFPIHHYDPAIEKYKQRPSPADIVVCTDVLEHIEPEYLDEVLDDLKTLVKKVGFFAIHLQAAYKTLSDGRNAHLSLFSREEWESKIKERFTIIKSSDDEFHLIIMVTPKEI